MPCLNPDALCSWSEGQWFGSPRSHPEGLCIDSRKINENELFVALRAERDGHDFIADAWRKGAAGAMVDHRIDDLQCPQLVVSDTLRGMQRIAQGHRRTFGGSMIAITGSCGKTSTKEILKVVLKNSLCTEGNLNNHLGIPLTLCRIDPSVHERAVIEAGISQTGEMLDLSKLIDAEFVVITSIGEAHLEGLGSVEEIAAEKSRLWTGSRRNPMAVFPEDCLAYESIKREFNSGRDCLVLCEGPPKQNNCSHRFAHYQVSPLKDYSGGKSRLTIWRHGLSPIEAAISNVSKGMARNLALAFLLAWKIGLADEEICERLPQYRSFGLRGSRLSGRGNDYFLDCYNANPLSMVDTMDFFTREFRSRPKLYVLGGMDELGSNGASLHEKVGEKIRLESQDRVVLVGNDAAGMVPGILRSGGGMAQIECFEKTADATSMIEEFEGAILFKGSRSYNLESLVPSWATESVEETIHAAC